MNEEYDDLSSLTLEELEKLELNLRGFEEEPVDIETFIFDPYFLGNYFSGTKFSPHWLDFLNRIYEKKIDAPAFLIFERGCLSGSTEITLATGEHYTMKELAEIFAGSHEDLFIESYDLSKGIITKNKILNCFSTGRKKTYLVATQEGIIECTGNHKFLSSQDIWVSIDEGTLLPDSVLKNLYYDDSTVLWIEETTHNDFVYDLTIENTHNYILNNGIISHNSIGRGKCFYKNTKIPLLNHINNQYELTIEEIYKTFNENKLIEEQNQNNPYFDHNSTDLWVLSYNIQEKRYEPDKIIDVTDNGFQDLYKITLDNDEEVICTSHHPFLTKDNQWVTIENGLEVNKTSLKPYNWKVDNNWNNTPEYNHSIKKIEYFGVGQTYDLTTERNHNFVISAGLISHNSTTACIGALYDQYMLMCLKSPQEYFGLVPTEQIVLFIMNVTLGLSEKVLMGKINDMINNSPYFAEKQQAAISLRKRGRTETKTRFPKGIDIRSGSRVSHTLGTAIHCLSKDTLIPIVGKGELTIEEISHLFHYENIELSTYSLDIENKTTLPGRITNVFFNCKRKVYRVKLNNGKFIDCTLNHRLLGADNQYHHVIDLKTGDRLLSFQFLGNNCINPYLNNSSHEITSIEYLGHEIVYDLEIEKYHNFALSSGVYSHNSAILSEAAFSIYNNQFMEAFNSILARQESRFLSDGKSSGRIWIDSSEKDTGSILNELCDKYRDKSGVIIDAGPLWEIRPWNYGVNNENKFCDFFYVYKGSDREPASFINMKDTSQIARLANDEPNSILVVPEEHRIRFEADIEEALRDLGGVATASKYRLFRNMKMLLKAFQGMPLYDDVIELDFYNQDDQIINHCKLPQYFDHLPSPNSMRYIHVDIGVSGDKLGFAMSYISGRKDVEVQKDITNINTNKTVDSMITTITELAFSIKNKAGQQVPLNKVRVFIKWLKDKGVLIGGVSSDSFQSASMLQEMKLIGIESSVISVDRTSDPYIYLRNAIYEGRSILPSNSLLRKELENLEISPDGSKVDHPDVFPGGIEVGSKDVADAVCMAYDTKLFTLSNSSLTVEQLYRRGWRKEYIISYDLETGFAYPQKIKQVIRNNIPESLLRITLNDKSHFDVTDDHLILTSDKTYVKAQELTTDHKLISLANSAKKYYEYNSRQLDDEKKIKKGHTTAKEGEMIIADLSNILYFSTPLMTKKIISIDRIPNSHYVYDLQLEDIHNFAISNLIFLHNCGSTYNCFKNQNKFNLLDALSSAEADKMILYSSPDIDEKQLSLLEEGKSKSPLINNIMNQWSEFKQSTDENDPYLDYLKSLDFMGAKDPSGDVYSNLVNKR